MYEIEELCLDANVPLTAKCCPEVTAGDQAMFRFLDYSFNFLFP
jgi:hypothetical protein